MTEDEPTLAERIAVCRTALAEIGAVPDHPAALRLWRAMLPAGTQQALATLVHGLPAMLEALQDADTTITDLRRALATAEHRCAEARRVLAE